MSDYPFVQINHGEWINFLVVDIDHDDAQMRLHYPGVPTPHWIITNPVNGHAQAGWMIDPVRTEAGSAPRPRAFAEAVQRALVNLTGGDPHFARFIVRNPVAVHPAGEVVLSARTQPYGLRELKAHMVDHIDRFTGESAWNPAPQGLATADQQVSSAQCAVGGRNDGLFRATRRYLRGLWRSKGVTPCEETSLEFARSLNAQLEDPLEDPEVSCLARSAVRQVLKWQRHGKNTSTAIERDPVLAELGRRGGRSRSTEKVEAARRNVQQATQSRSGRARELADQAMELRRQGATIQEICAVVRRARSTVAGWLRALRPETEECPISEATGSAPSRVGLRVVALKALAARAAALEALLPPTFPDPLPPALLRAVRVFARQLEDLARWVQ